MASKCQSSGAKGKGKAGVKQDEQSIPQVYQDMLAEVLPAQSTAEGPPLKKRRIGRRIVDVANETTSAPVEDVILRARARSEGRDAYEDEDDLEFEDVMDAYGNTAGSTKTLQTAFKDSDDDTAESEPDLDMSFEADVNDPKADGDLELTLNPKNDTLRRTAAERRRVITKEERGLRLQIHKMHLLCLFSHLERRNRWCNDEDVQASLQPLLNKKMLTFLLPKSSLSQFGRTESLKRGLDQACTMWKSKYSITARGMQRALWAEDESDLQRLKLAGDTDFAFEKSDFLSAAKSLKGSRDVGAQLFCALLRGAGLDVRLVCSLQSLSFTPGGPTTKGASQAVQASSPEVSDEEEMVDIQGKDSPFVTNSAARDPHAPFSARRRLGHPQAAGYQMPEMSSPARPPPKPKVKKIHESPYPVFWLEVLDEAHQRWLSVDPLVTGTIAKPRAFEPPATDRENNMSYVIAFEEDGIARDVTRRYTKAYNAKTRKQRVDSTDRGVEWWRKALRPYTRSWQTDIDQIEDADLATAEAREPMPKNVADFKDHPYYALERHMKRNEVLVTRHEVGRIAAGRDPNVPGRKRLESVYRRRDIKVAKSADAWYRLGREVKMGEQPLKTVPARRRPHGDERDGEDAVDTELYTEDQTELFVAPPVVNGRVPKNSFGNIDIYVPSMVPPGSVHIADDMATRAARLLGIDYADALTGFEFRGRHGTAVLKGIVVAAEYQEAMEAVLDGYRDQQARMEEEARTVAALKTWKRFLVGLRIKERIDAYGEDDGAADRDEGIEYEKDEGDDIEDEYVDDGGGGFFPE